MMTEMKWYNVELLQGYAEKLQQHLYDMGVKFEISAAGVYYHFEILLPKGGKEVYELNEYIDSLYDNVFYNVG